ncbi:MAG: FAD-binding oxidoreductase [Gemmatimonadaceae bacterium]|nr:FAD-binding oxidoreductase [Gemmatimonadaceae bacterium]
MNQADVINRPRWDDHDWSPLPPLPHDGQADLCVIGLGGSGLSAISEALDLGAKSVIGIDAVDVAAGAAGRNGGLLLAGPMDYHHDAVEKFGLERTLAIHAITKREMERIVQETPGVAHFPGSLRIASSAEELEDCRRQFEAMRANGLPVEHYDGPEGQGLLFPEDGVMQPLRRARALATALRARGAQLYGGTVARSIEPGRVRTEYGTITCRHVIVCVDGKLEWLFPELLAEVRTARLQMLATSPQLPRRYTRPVSTRYGFDYWQQLEDGTILLGGGRDKFEDDEWTTDDGPDKKVQAYLTEMLASTLGVAADVTHRWAASVSFTDSGLPIARALGGGVFVVGAYSGTGNLVGAVCGRGAAQLALTGKDTLLAPFQD